MKDKRRGSELIEFTLMAIPLLFISITIVECSIAMWEYNSMSNAVTVAARYAASHGASCASPNTCTIRVEDVANLMVSTAPILNAAKLNVTLTTNSGSTSCSPLNTCTSTATQFPSTTDNAVGMDIKISATYHITNPMPMYWPPVLDRDNTGYTLGARLAPEDTVLKRTMGVFRFSRLGLKRGQAAMLAVFNITILFGVLGFSVDFGIGQFKKHATQAAADAAAMAAASWAASNSSTCTSGITCNVTTSCTIPTSVSTPFGAACVYAQSNGYTNGTNGQTVTVLANNTSSPVTGNNPTLWFEVTVGDSYNTMFGIFGGMPQFAIKSVAVASVAASTAGGDCIIALSSSGTTFTDTAGGNVTASGCSIYSNGSMNVTSNGLSGQAIYYDGTYSGGHPSTPVATSVTTRVSDPFASVPAPSVPACSCATGSTRCNAIANNISISNTGTLSPGTYCGGLQLSNSHTVTFGSGLYIINGTDSGGNSLDFNGGGAITGSGVTFFITGQNGYTAGPVKITGGGNTTLSAPSSGTYQGLLVYQDRSVSYSQANAYTGGGSNNVTGTWYFPTTEMDFTAGGSGSAEAIVAYTVKFTGGGNSTFTADTNCQYTNLCAKGNSSLISLSRPSLISPVYGLLAFHPPALTNRRQRQ